MTADVGFGKRSRLVADLTERICSGLLVHGERLPGENTLAQRYRVSRGTVRGALSKLQRRNLIATETGVDSFVTFDGVPLDRTGGWARALAAAGADVRVEVLGIEAGGSPELTKRYGRLVTVRRLCRGGAGRPVSLETATVPGTGLLADLPSRGLVRGSLTATLQAAGLHPVGGEQWICVLPLDAAAARLLERRPGEMFLHATRTTLTADGELVERVESLLDPARFRFHLAFGRR
ncbi:GntR family transcriptional regulator [Pseudonocardia aurantiaca]|uniref:GntR family transcriptional regulator n=1 Tax=Pseudonocardia aurantiaca TaxID=75290 RepID=A0ABW4FP70_9PSEU